MNSTFRLGVAALMSSAALLSGCSTTQDDEEPGRIEIDYASIRGFDNRENDGTGSASEVYPDSSGEDLLLHWDVEGGETPPFHSIQWFVSDDDRLDRPADSADPDVLVLQRNCGTGSGDACPGMSGDIACNFNMGNQLKCGLGVFADGAAANLTSYFSGHNGLPGGYYLILLVRDSTSPDTDQKAFRVNFN